MKAYRIEPQYAVDGITGFPTLHYAVQERIWGRWVTLEVQDSKQAALQRLTDLQAFALAERERKLSKRRSLMRRMSGAQK